MTTAKFELGNQHPTRNIFRVVALRDFGNVKAGDIGGWVQYEENLSHDGNCWIADDASVSGDARVFGNALVSGIAAVTGSARVFGNARVSGEAIVFNSAQVSGNAQVSDMAWVFAAQVSGNARVSGNATVSDNEVVSGNEVVHAPIGNAVPRAA